MNSNQKHTIKLARLFHDLRNKYEFTLMKQVRSRLAIDSLERQIRAISKNIRSDAKILDFGCGLGVPTVMLKDNLPRSRISAIDIKKWVTWDTINKYYSIDFRRFNGRCIPFPRNTFDAVVMFGVLEHVKELLYCQLFQIPVYPTCHLRAHPSFGLAHSRLCQEWATKTYRGQELRISDGIELWDVAMNANRFNNGDSLIMGPPPAGEYSKSSRMVHQTEC